MPRRRVNSVLKGIVAAAGCTRRNARLEGRLGNVRNSNYGSDFNAKMRRTKNGKPDPRLHKVISRVPFGQDTVMLRHGDGAVYWGWHEPRFSQGSGKQVRRRHMPQLKPEPSLPVSCPPAVCYLASCQPLAAEPTSPVNWFLAFTLKQLSQPSLCQHHQSSLVLTGLNSRRLFRASHF